ncbi:hypothetical protein [Agaribacter flavus]|uniref:Uncharacterized protein n=1 Tax=Agaribacter flavus TaxID=1902781 RepID=A0ABV7FJK8_9ALTE
MTLTVDAYLTTAIDFGYASATFDGYNNSSLGIEALFSSNRVSSLKFLAELSIGGTDVRQTSDENNQFWLGVHYLYSW